MAMHQLGRLITDRMEHPDNRWSLSTVVTRMRKAGHDNIGKSRLGQIRSAPVESIKKDVIFALADGLGVTPLTVANAALESMGVETRPAEVTDSAATIQIDPSLGDDDRRQLLALLREIRATADERRLFYEEARLASEALREDLDGVLFEVAQWAREIKNMDRQLFLDGFAELLRTGRVTTAAAVIELLDDDSTARDLQRRRRRELGVKEGEAGML